MFGLFKSDPKKKLQKQYEQVLGQAQHAQRNGDMKLFAELSAKADAIYQEIKKLG
ncbi:DUF6435 family protein [Salinibius halmophilus]|uniref:DUF6435 family protein n=1 Tax=Salinibius halmophilus TaxID=1853216 RepID=UPI000E664B04|nr:DUF6435 family protein [Salinibius halmophilus]